jgi:hypothetical protein
MPSRPRKKEFFPPRQDGWAGWCIADRSSYALAESCTEMRRGSSPSPRPRLDGNPEGMHKPRNGHEFPERGMSGRSRAGPSIAKLGPTIGINRHLANSSWHGKRIIRVVGKRPKTPGNIPEIEGFVSSRR